MDVAAELVEVITALLGASLVGVYAYKGASAAPPRSPRESRRPARLVQAAEG
jgi:D-serine deaminase-like pyridoxal phosphate-dependent protein